MKHYSIYYDTMCLYCKKCCDIKFCSISKGKTPPYAIRHKNGNIIECSEFLEEIPFPKDKEEIAILAGFDSFKNFYYTFSAYLRKQKAFAEFQEKVLKCAELYRYRKPLEFWHLSSWQMLNLILSKIEDKQRRKNEKR